ncbi:histidinol-phosphatase [Candidatus Rariloculus sp.]|uniref:histidinol-phosphatase n=1 Tax=Candidatus Rariloculus sp. TaxID=3101265 RepID=UPI003D0F5146
MVDTWHELAELEKFSLELARAAGSTAKAYFRKPVAVENKDGGGFDPVTSADRAIESLLRDAIIERYPDHGIVGEEEGARAAQSRYTWIIDPIDGTRSFITGSPLWGTLVGLLRDGSPLLGVLCQPVLNELFLGTRSGAWLIADDRRDRLSARQCRDLSQASLACTHPNMFDAATADAFAALGQRCLMSRFGGDCYNYAMLAAGFTDLVVEGRLKSYDIVPLIPIVEGAGGVVSDWQGRPPLDGGNVVAAATPELHAQALEVLNDAASGRP